MSTGELIVGEIADEMGADPHNESPAGLIRLAIQKDLDIEKLERLIALQRQRDEDLARQEFCEALSNFQGSLGPIGREDRVDAGRAGRRKYASLGTIFQAIREPMRKHGLSFRFRQQQVNGEISITCIVSHAMGHSEETSLSAAPDASGGKNPIQSMGSTVTYLQRYTLVAALGLTTVDDDDDGQHAAAPVVSEEEKARQQQAAAVKAQLFSGQKPATATANTANTTVTTVEVTPNAQPVVSQQPVRPDNATVDTTAAGTITDAQRKRIEELYDLLNVAPESRAKALSTRKANSLRNLSTEQAADILAKLEGAAKQRASKAAADANANADTSKLDGSATGTTLAGPCSQEQIDRAKALVVELEQMQPGISAKIKAKLKRHGLEKLSSLTMAEMDSLLQQLAVKNIEKFFEMTFANGAPF